MSLPTFDRDIQQQLLEQLKKESEARIADMAARRKTDEVTLEVYKASAAYMERTARALEDLRKDLLSGILGRK